MRTVQSSNVIQIAPGRPCYGRRPIHPAYAGVTCLVLVRHSETAKALFVSDTGDRSKAVWVPRAMLAIDPASRLGFLVATMSKRFAEQKNLHPRFINPQDFGPAMIEAWIETTGLAAKKRNQFRNHHELLPYPGKECIRMKRIATHPFGADTIEERIFLFVGFVMLGFLLALAF